MKQLPPGKYIRAANGVIHNYTDYGAAIAGNEVFMVTDGAELSEPKVDADGGMNTLIAYLLENPLPTFQKGKDAGKPDTVTLSTTLGFEVNQAMIATALDEVALIKAEAANAG